MRPRAHAGALCARFDNVLTDARDRSPRCQHSECADAKCPTCVYLRRRGDGPLRTRLLKRDKDRDLWHLHPAAYDEPWAYAEDRSKLTALQASYVLGRERALRGSRARL